MDIASRIKARIEIADQAMQDKYPRSGDGLRRACASAVKQELENLLWWLERQP